MDVRSRLDAAADRGFLARLSDADRARLAARLRPQRFASGSEAVSQGDPSRDAYLVLAGRAVANTFSRDGRALSYRDLEPGDLFGELAALDGLPRSAFVIAVGSLEVGVLSRAALSELIESSPGFARALLEHLCATLRSTSDRLFENVALLMRERLIRELLRRARTSGAGPDDVAELRPAPTHLDLAQRIGAHREGVTKELAALARRGLVERRDGAIRLLSVTALEAELDEEAGSSG